MIKMTESQALEYIKANVGNLATYPAECFALRGDNYIPVQKFRRSWESPDGERAYRLPGVCGCYICENDMFGDYTTVTSLPISNARRYGKNVFLLQGEKVGYGTDEGEGEVVLRNHKIIAIID